MAATQAANVALGKGSICVPEPIVKTCKMCPEMEEAAKEFVVEAMRTFTIEREVAECVKRKFDEKFGAKWHCIVGRRFAPHVSYEPNHYIYMQVGDEVSNKALDLKCLCSNDAAKNQQFDVVPRSLFSCRLCYCLKVEKQQQSKHDYRRSLRPLFVHPVLVDRGKNRTKFFVFCP